MSATHGPADRRQPAVDGQTTGLNGWMVPPRRTWRDTPAGRELIQARRERRWADARALRRLIMGWL